MPKLNQKTTKRSSIEDKVMRYVRGRPVRGATADEISENVAGVTANAVRVLLKKLTDEGYLERAYAYDQKRHGQPVGAYRYKAAS